MPPRERPLSILVTDRSPAVRSLLASALVHFGHRPELCDDGRRMLQRAREGRFDLLLLDAEAEPGGGLGLLLSLRGAGIDTPAVLTARGLPSRSISGWCTASQVRLLLKPFSLGDLERALRGHGPSRRSGRG
jgi:DNA-binding response OmpR family regulator